VEQPFRVAARQTRRYTANGNGHTTVHVELEGALVAEGLVLADIEPPLLGISGGTVLKGPRRDAAVQCLKCGHGYRYVLEGVPPAAKPGRWSMRYDVAPGLHASHSETVNSERDDRGPVNVCDHVMRIPCRELELQVELASRLATAEPYGESPCGPLKLSDFTEFHVFEDRKSVRLLVKEPTLGHRYGIRYWFESAPTEPSAEVLQTCEAVLQACLPDRETPHTATAILRAELNEAIRDCLSRVNEANKGSTFPGPDLIWKALLWQPSRQELITCFGEFEAGHWLTRYRLGEGVAGHCLRTCLPTGYVRSPRDRRLFTADRQGDDAEWVLCIPLTAGEEGPPVGVVLFSGHSADNHASRILQTLSKEFDVLSGQRRSGRLVHDLSWVINVSFWAAVADLELLEPSSRQVANSLGRDYKNVGSERTKSQSGARRLFRASPEPSPPPLSEVASSSSSDRTPTGFIPPSREESVARYQVRGAIIIAVIGATATIIAALFGAFGKLDIVTTALHPTVAAKDTRLNSLKVILAAAASTRPQLEGKDLSQLPLDDIDFRAALLRNANLAGASLVGADLRHTDLRGADLSKADLRKAQLRGACYDEETKLPAGFYPPKHGVFAAVSELRATQEAPGSLVSVSWEPSSEWMVVRWYDATGACSSGSNCNADSSDVRQAPFELLMPKGQSQIKLFRAGAPHEEASRSIDVR
jgi:hypothetical protein